MFWVYQKLKLLRVELRQLNSSAFGMILDRVRSIDVVLKISGAN